MPNARWPGLAPPDLFASTRIFTDVAGWLRARTELPIWYSEWHTVPGDIDLDERDALMATILMRLAPAADVALIWVPESQSGHGHGNRESLWSDTTRPGGGKPLPFFAILQAFRKSFPPGKSPVRAESASAEIGILASPTCAMLVNQTPRALAVSIDATPPMELRRYKVRVVEFKAE